MRRIAITLVVLLCPLLLAAQENYGFPFGKTTFTDFDLKTYPNDTIADAYFIREGAEAHVDYDTNNKLIFTYHAKIRILKKSGTERANIEVLLRTADKFRKEEIRNVEASAFNLVNNRIVETKMDAKSLFVERNDERFSNIAKFAIPDVREGTVIEYKYVIESPFLRTFRKWEFQSDIPKLYSEYWTVIPGNYIYNITLRGYLQLTGKKDDIVQNCIQSGTATANCISTRYSMKDVPAFRSEDYMIAKENYISSINFELSEVRHWDGRIDKITKEWKDADEELKLDEKFGRQLKRGADVVDGYIDPEVLKEPDPLKKAQRIFDFIKYHFSWNNYYGVYSDLGIKKAFDQKKGNSADINLSLVAALKYAGFSAEPVLLATRHLERPIELHPVLSDFNYVIARVTIGDKIYFLDAVDDFLPFGLISQYCFNGKGRVMAESGSFWVELKPADRDRVVTQINLKLSKEGQMTGAITRNYYGYGAVDQRKELYQHQDEKAYLEEIKTKNHDLSITNYKRVMEDDLSKPVVETFEVEMSAFDAQGASHFLFNPFMHYRLTKNPFKTETRTFPVDFGIPMERSLILSIEYPDNVQVASLPEKMAIAIPNGGGRYLYTASADGAKLNVSNVVSITKPLYMPEEYPYLRELYSRRLQAENADIVFQKK